MNNSFTLDKWDMRLIRLLKQQTFPTTEQMRALWAERNEVDIKLIHISFVVERMAEIVEACNPRPLASLLVDGQADNAWKYGEKMSGEYWTIWANVLGSRIRHTEVVKLPGYREWIEREVELEAMQANADKTVL